MSVTRRLARSIVVGGIAALALAASTVVTTPNSFDDASIDDAPLPAVRIQAPKKLLDVIESSDPAATAIAVSRRLYATSPVAVLVDARDAAAQRLGITSASTLHVPVLLDDPAAPAELRRLKATTVLTFGATRDVPEARAVPLIAAGAAASVERAGKTFASPPRRVDVIVVTRSREANAAALANAVSAGADVIKLHSTDPRRTPAAAKVFADRSTTPLIALGTPFAKELAYPLAVVRAQATQASGGYFALPGKTYTAMYGIPGSGALGVLGEQGVRASVARVKKLARKYEAVGKSDFVPTFEIIATLATASAGKDKNYSAEASVKSLRPLVDAAGKAGVYVILDLQPGRSDFLTQAKRYQSLLRRPYVGLALDPEWRLKKGQKHLRQIGSVKAEEINRVGDWLARLTRRHALPQKVLVLHQFSASMIKARSRVDASHPELATVIHVDGQGSQPAKRRTWKLLHRGAPNGVYWGWKNFVDEDKPMLDVRDTWRTVKNHPALITYQ